MVTLQSAENALKTVYLGVVANQLNINANPLLGKIKQSTSDVWGKEIRKLAPFGINGGIGAGTETGTLPSAAGNKYVQFVSELKNLYGKIEISDKAIRASQNNAGAFVNLLNDEMEGLIKASSFNFGRMLYGDGSGLLATVSAFSSSTKAITCANSDVKNLIEGLVIDIYTGTNLKASGLRITYVDRANKCFYVDMPSNPSYTIAKDDTIYVQGSKGLEITGLGKIFSSSETLYGVSRAANPWLQPYSSSVDGEISETVIQKAIDFLEEASGSEVDFITCSTAVRQAYQQYMTAFKRNVDIMELAGGYKTISYNGIPVVADRFIKNDTMYLLNTKDFTLHQLCDWKWLEGEDGKIIKQNPNYATYTATLVKYADLICDRPNGSAMLTGISATVENPFIPKVTVNNTVESNSSN